MSGYRGKDCEAFVGPANKKYYFYNYLGLAAALTFTAVVASAAAAASKDYNNYNYPQATVHSISASKHLIIPFSAHNYLFVPPCAVSRL